MRIDTLEDLYLKQLKDIYSANVQALDVAKKMAHAATDQDLAGALNEGAKGLQDSILSLEEMALRHDERLDCELCKGMEGLANDAKAHALEQVFIETETQDAMIITQYQRLAHFAISGYGCLAAFADRLELDDDLFALRTCLDASYHGDRTMIQLATGGIDDNRYS